MFIKSVWNKDKNNHYHNISLEKASSELPQVFVRNINAIL